MPDFTAPLKDRLWQLRFKLGPNPVDTTVVEARNAEYAERIGRKWCESQGEGMRVCKFVSVRPLITADETILSETTLAKPAPSPLPAPTRQ